MSSAVTPKPGSKRLAVVTTHPIQYYAPWFRHLALQPDLQLKVFYLWETEKQRTQDPGFRREVRWDVPLLNGYDHEFVPNTSVRPGSDRYFGVNNPTLPRRLAEFSPDAALLIGYRYPSLIRLIFTSQRRRGFPLLFRGDSHRLNTDRKVEAWAAHKSPKASGHASNETQDAAGVRALLRKKVISAVYRRLAAFLYVGAANRDYFRMHGVQEEKLFFAPHAVDNARFTSHTQTAKAAAMQWRQELGIPDDHLVVLFAGKFERKKRPLDLLDAFRQLSRADVSLLLVGNGELEQQLRAAAAEIRNVFFAPFQNQSAMARTYAACDLFVLPSYGPEESWGLAVNEALCLGRAVVVSSHVGCAADLVRPRENGLVFPAGDVEALANALTEALSDRKRLARWGERGRRVVDDYDYAHATAGLREALEFVAARRAG